MDRTPQHLSRRHFLGLTGVSLLTLLSGINARWADALGPLLKAATTANTRVHIHRFDPAATDTTAAVREAMLAATDLSWLHAGDSVFIKVASNSDYAPPSVTSPAALAGVVEVLQEAGAGTVYVGDMSGAQFVRHLPEETIGSTRDNMRTNGLLDAAEAAGAVVHCFEEVPFAEAYIPGVPTAPDGSAIDHHWGDDLHVAEILDRVDHIINLPRLGKHVLAGASLGLKNAIGWASDHSRMVLHRDGATFHEKIAEVNAIPQLREKTRLVLTLVDKALTTYGPDAGYPLPLAQPLVIAADDIVSHDQVALLTLLWARQSTPATALAEDPYPDETNGLNWWFVRVTWGADAANAYQDLPAFPNLADSTLPQHVNLAFDLVHGGRPAAVEIVPGGLPLPDDLTALLTDDAALGITVPAG